MRLLNPRLDNLKNCFVKNEQKHWFLNPLFRKTIDLNTGFIAISETVVSDRNLFVRFVSTT